MVIEVELQIDDGLLVAAARKPRSIGGNSRVDAKTSIGSGASLYLSPCFALCAYPLPQPLGVAASVASSPGHGRTEERFSFPKEVGATRNQAMREASDVKGT
jgi:hypothetical protein